jgi:hypothetical protein
MFKARLTYSPTMTRKIHRQELEAETFMELCQIIEDFGEDSILECLITHEAEG